MTIIPITCDNCGAKYKLPPTFKGAQAKCQKCGSVIDVAKQRDAAGNGASEGAAAKPTPSRPAAAAKPAIDRSKSRPGTRKTAAAAASDKGDRPGRGASSRARRSSKDDAEEGSPRRGRAVQKKNNMPMILGGVGLVVIIIVVAMMMMGGDDKTTETTAQTNNETGKAAIKDAVKAAPTTDTAKDAPKPEDPPAGHVTVVEGPDTTDAKPTPKVDPTPPEPDDAGKPKRKLERWEKQKNAAQTMGDVKSAAELYGEVPWPESVDAATKTEILSIAEDLDAEGGIRSIRAKNKLIKKGYAGIFGILEHLRTLDYRQTDDAAYGFELNKALEDITGGFWNAKYEPVQAGETMHPAKAQWNTKTVKAWMGLVATWPDEGAFKTAKRKKAKKED